MSTSILFDLETLSLKPTAVVTEIAAIAIHYDATSRRPPVVVDEIELFPCIASQIQTYRHICPDTIAFHKKQKSLPKKFATGLEIPDALQSFTGFVKTHNPQNIWIWGKDFDRPILEDLYQETHIPFPFRFSRIHCARDAWHLAYGEDKKPAPRSHHALPDCRASFVDLTAALTATMHIHRI
jgi:hypothetical protein